MLTSISLVTCHSSRLFIMWHPGTNKQTNKHKHTHSNHVSTCVLALRLVSRSLLCNNLSTLLKAYGGALVYYFLEQRSFLFSFPLGSLLPFSLPSISFSQVNPPEYYWLLQHSGISAYMCFCFVKSIMVKWGGGETFEEACLPLSLSHSL